MQMSKIYLAIIIVICLSLPNVVSGQADVPKTLSLSCRNVDIRILLGAITKQYGVNFKYDAMVTGNVEAYLKDAPFEEGLRAILESNGFALSKEENTYQVSKKVEQQTVTVIVEDGRLTIGADNVDAMRIVQELARAKVNIVAGGELTGNITAHLTDVPIAEGLRDIFASIGFPVNESGGTYRVARRINRQTPGFYVFVHDNKVIVDAKGASAEDVLLQIAHQAKINLTTIGNLQGKITMRLDGVPLEQALDNIVAAGGGDYRKLDDIYIVGTATTQAGQNNPLLERKIIWLKHLDAIEIMKILPFDIPKSSITISPDRNAIILLSSPKTLKKIEEIIAELDVDNDEIRSRQQFALSVEVDDEDLITIDAKDASIEMVVREIAIRAHIDVTVLSTTGGAVRTRRQPAQKPAGAKSQQQRQQPRQRRRRAQSAGFAGNINLRLEKATLKEVFDALFEGTEYTYKLQKRGDKDFYIVGTGELSLGVSNPLVVTKKIPLNYLEATTINELLPSTISEEHITVLPEQNAILVMAAPDMIDELEEYIRQIDSPTPQVMIQALLFEISSGAGKELGIGMLADKDRITADISPILGITFDTLEKVPERFTASLAALVKENKAQILASPRVAVVNGEKAQIRVGVTHMFETTTEIYKGADVPVGGYTRRAFNTIDTGITLEITPWIGASGDITMTIAPNIEDADMISKEESKISTRSIDTIVRVKDGGMIVIGGLLQKKELTSEERVPVISRIPIMGHLFKNSRKTETQTELIVVIEPKIIQ